MNRELMPIETGMTAKSVSTKESLEHEREKVRQRLLELDEALTILEKHPDIERLLTIMGGHQY